MGTATKTIKLKIVGANKGKLENQHQTKKEINNLLAFYIGVINEHKEILNIKSFTKDIEILTHRTKSNPEPKMPLDLNHPKPPSILKRSIINHAVGKMKSYQSNHDNWTAKGKQQGEPKLPTPRMNPAFYYTDFSLEFGDLKDQFISLRVFDGNQWGLINYPVKLTKQFLEMYRSMKNIWNIKKNLTNTYQH